MAERRIVNGWIYEKGGDGSIRPVGPAQQQAPADPTFGYKGPQVASDLTGKNLQNNKTVVDTRGSEISNQKAIGEIAANTKRMMENPISDRDQALINGMRQSLGDMPGVLRDIHAAATAVDRFQPEPGKGSKYSWMVPEDNDWPITAWAKNAVGALAGLTQEDVDNYQAITSLQNQAVLNSQIAQKGPQTESDAMRMKLAGVSPNKGVLPNAQLLARQAYDADMKMRRPGFYEAWANRLGSTHALNKSGKSADDVWNESYQGGLQKLSRDPRYTGMFGRRFRSGASNGWGRAEVSD